MSQVTLRQLTKTYLAAGKAPPFDAVAGIDLEVRSGEFMVLVGPSGCGKSTTLRMIAGLEEITVGEILIDGRRVNDVEPKDRDIAMVFQNYALYPHMKVGENMAFGLKLRNLPKPEIEQRVHEVAAMLGLEDLLDRKPKDLSGGQRQRVAVGRAIVRKPKVFLFDEPLSNLDAKMRTSMRTEIARLHARLGATMIYVTHDQTEAMTLGDRICVMQDGHIRQTAAPLEVYHRPANLFVAGFIGSPPMNLFHGSVRAAGAGHEFVFAKETDAAPLSLSGDLARPAAQLSGRSAVLGLRPEDIAIGSPATMQARVEFTESLGAETYLHCQAAGTSFIARVGSEANPDAGAVLPLRFNLARAHLFDPASSLAVR